MGDDLSDDGGNPAPAGTTTRYGLIPPTQLATLSGLEVLRGMLDGRYPLPPVQDLFGFAFEHIERGRTRFSGMPRRELYNPISTVHAGWTATVLDSCMASAVWSDLDAGLGFTTMEFKISLLKPITEATGRLYAEGALLSRGKRAATAEARMTDSDGRLLAHATSTCIIFPHA